MANYEIREAAKKKRVALWEVADAIGCSESTFTRTLRHELDPEEKERILSIISKLSNRE